MCLPFLQLPFPPAPFPFGCQGVPHPAALALQFAPRCAEAPRKAAWPWAEEEALAETSPWGPAATCESRARRGSPRWGLTVSLSKPLSSTLKFLVKLIHCLQTRWNYANIFTCFNRQGNVLLPSHRFQSTLASPENKQPLPCFFGGAKAQFTAWDVI